MTCKHKLDSVIRPSRADWIYDLCRGEKSTFFNCCRDCPICSGNITDDFSYAVNLVKHISISILTKCFGKMFIPNNLLNVTNIRAPPEYF